MPPSPPREPGVSPRRARLLLAVLGLGAALGALELALQLQPALLPASYRARFPGHGTELFHPDVFARTPVEGVLLPHLAVTRVGPPPADLVELGVAPATADDDRRAFPRVVLPADELGFPNPSLPQQAELVLLGDSFGVAAGVREPEGLQAALERATGLAVFNASLAGIGPAQERWLLETVVLPRAPRAVLWLFFSGNDLTASYEPWLARRAGHATWAEAWPELRRPRLYLPDLLRRTLAAAPPPRCAAPLPPFELELADGGARPVWFAPDQLAQLGWSRETWRAHPAWEPVQAELAAAHELCAARGVKLLVVYLPSAPEVLLPFVRADAELAARTLAALGLPPPEGEPAELLARLLAQRGALEALVREFCAARALPFLSAVPALDVQASEGELGFLVTDTHWSSVGQRALLEPLLAFLRAEGVL